VKGRLVATPNDKRTPAQLRAAELRAQAQRSDRRRRTIAIAVGTVVAVAVVVAFVALGLKKKPAPAAVVAQPGQAVSFPAPTGSAVDTAVKAAGLQVLGQEMLQFHIHSHLEVVNDGTEIPVPANIGIHAGVGLSPLHTHDDSGVIHIESEKQADFTLGQVFKEWNVALSPTCLANLCADDTHELKVYVNGEAVTGDPNAVKLAEHEDITVAYLTKGKAFTPQRFDFAAAKL
jgi:hypothetical protein